MLQLDPLFFQEHRLDETYSLFTGSLPADLLTSFEGFQQLWDLHPADYHRISMPSGQVSTPRWQQAYGADYHYTGQVNRALPIPEFFKPFVDWSQEQICASLNGVLVNWYQGTAGHYIGKHRDSTHNVVDQSPIVTISLGENRIFRMRPWRKTGKQDFPVVNGSVIVLPYATNLAYTHEVPHFRKYKKDRISITLRAFQKTTLSTRSTSQTSLSAQ